MSINSVCHAGYLSKKDLDFLHKEGEKSLSSNFTFWYGHFPSSVISTASYMGLRNIIGKFGYVYLNGHLHDLERLAPIQYALHSNGLLLFTCNFFFVIYNMFFYCNLKE